MALKAVRSMAGAQQKAEPQAQPKTEVQDVQDVQEAPKQASAPQAQAAPPAVQGNKPTAVGRPASPNELADLNAGILEGIDDLGVSGNFVTVDGTELLYKGTNTSVDHIDMIVSYGKRFYQWVDESDPERKVFHNSDTKLDDRYKLKFEIRWLEDRGEEEPTEFTMTLSTTSAMNFIEYIKKLANMGLSVGSVVTRMTVSRQVSRDNKNRYSRVEFEALDYNEYVNNGVAKPIGARTSDARTI